jgi:hypothetical protein
MGKQDKPLRDDSVFMRGGESAKSLNATPDDEDVEGHARSMGSSSARSLGSSSARSLNAAPDDEDVEGHRRSKE